MVLAFHLFKSVGPTNSFCFHKFQTFGHFTTLWDFHISAREPVVLLHKTPSSDEDGELHLANSRRSRRQIEIARAEKVNDDPVRIHIAAFFEGLFDKAGAYGTSEEIKVYMLERTVAVFMEYAKK